MTDLPSNPTISLSASAPFGIVPLWVARTATSGGVHLYALMAGMGAEPHDPTCPPVQSALGEAIGWSTSKVQKTLKELEAIGALSMRTQPAGHEGRAHTHYALAMVPPPSSCVATSLQFGQAPEPPPGPTNKQPKPTKRVSKPRLLKVDPLEEQDPEAVRLAQLFADLQARRPDRRRLSRPPIGWVQDLKTLHGKDGLSWTTIEAVIRFHQDDPFWFNKIGTPAGMAAKWNTLVGQMESKRARTPNTPDNIGPMSPEAEARLVAEKQAGFAAQIAALKAQEGTALQEPF